MSKIETVFNFYLDASCHVALAVVSLTYLTYSSLNIPLNTDVFLFTFFGTIGTYNFIKFYGPVMNISRANWDIFIQTTLFLSTFCLLMSTYYLSQLPIKVWFCIPFLFVLIAAYNWPFGKGGKNLRSLGILKVFLVAIVWAIATVVLPVLASDLLFHWDVGILFIQQIVLVLVLLIPFEIRDINIDQSNLKTIPQRFGIKKTRVIGYVLIAVYFSLLFFKDSVDSSEIVERALLSLLLVAVVSRATIKQHKYYASFFVESIPIVWALLVFVLN